MRFVAVAAACLATHSQVVDAARQITKKHEEQVEMRTDDGHFVNASNCVDCPSYFKASAQEKSNRIWSNIEHDEYNTMLTDDHCASQGKRCHCDGLVRYGADSRFTSWKHVTGGIECSGSSFGGEDPAPWESKHCVCRYKFPMNYIGLLKRNLGDMRNRVNNGTMPLFFDRFSDQNPANAAKVIHTFGSTAQAKFVPKDNSAYTGMYASGTQNALIRLSMVADWRKPCKGGTDFNFDGCLKPSMAFKMLRSADHSSNIVAQVNLGDGVGWHFNFFSFVHSTELPEPHGMGAELVKELFSHAAEKSESNAVGVEELATQGSTKPSAYKAPRNLFFRAPSSLMNKFSDDEHDPRHDFRKLTAGTHLYNVYTIDFSDSRCASDGNPVEYKDLPSSCPLDYLGKVVTTSDFVASAYQDHRLFFQHERFRTKTGKWTRKLCRARSDLGPNSPFRMANNVKETCTNHCPEGTSEVRGGSCPNDWMV